MLNESMRRGEPWSGGERNAAFLSSGTASLDLVDAGPALGLDQPDDGRSAARLDVDFDGDDDLIVTNRTAPRLRILANRLADGAEHLGVRLAGTTSNRDAIGAVVFAEAVGASGAVETQRRTRTAGSGYLAQSSAWLRFGFGARAEGGRVLRARRVKLKVRWPGSGGPGSGGLEDFGEVRAGRRYVLVQGSGAASEAPAPATLKLSASPLVPPAPGPGARRRLVLPSPTSIPGLDVRARGDRTGKIFGLTPSGPRGTGRNTVVAVWDSTDRAATAGLGDLAALTAAGAEASVMLVSVDLGAGAPVGDESPGPGDADAARPDPLDFSGTRLAAVGWGGDILAPRGETSVILPELVAWRLDRSDAPALPWFFIFEPDGRLAVVRTGPWQAGDLAADLEVFAQPLAQRPAWSTPYPGRWADPPGEADLGRLRARLQRRGASVAVRELELGRIKTTSLGSAEVKIRLGRTALERGDFVGALARFESALLVESSSVLARRGRAYALHRLGRYTEALEEWTRALDLDPADTDTLANRALAAVAAGALGIAREDLIELTRREGAAAPVVRVVRRAVEEAPPPGDVDGSAGGGG
ncbi:MAG: tetratricopeptide repeat protein [Planctomycetota bacterium]|nr:tetratricopeptide repeat protein [Planctomycetota bacterium]